MISISNPEEAFDFLKKIGANHRLLNHAKLVEEVSVLIIEIIKKLGIDIDEDFIRIGALLHDAGKILFPDELKESGNRHEEGGEQLLLGKGIDPRIARCCMTHSRWDLINCSLEELIVALSDNLWKGTRQEQLELIVIKKVASLVSKAFWDIFIELDECFEEIAFDGSDRLERSFQD